MQPNQNGGGVSECCWLIYLTRPLPPSLTLTSDLTRGLSLTSCLVGGWQGDLVQSGGREDAGTDGWSVWANLKTRPNWDSESCVIAGMVRPG